MLLSEILSQELILSIANVASRKRLFQEIANCIAESCGVTAEKIFGALLERERLGPTGMGNGIAIPHARITGVSKIKGVFLKLDKPIDFDSVDRQKVDLVFAIIAPTDSGVDHLKALAKVSRVLRDQNICSKLRSTEETTALYSILTQDLDIKAA